jgi:hypothetical protein
MLQQLYISFCNIVLDISGRLGALRPYEYVTIITDQQPPAIFDQHRKSVAHIHQSRAALT